MKNITVIWRPTGVTYTLNADHNSVITLRIQIFSLVQVTPDLIAINDQQGTQLHDDAPLDSYQIHKPLVAYQQSQDQEFDLETGKLIVQELAWEQCCTKIYFGENAIEQPVFAVDRDAVVVCAGCAATCKQMVQKKIMLDRKLKVCQCSNCIFQDRVTNTWERVSGPIAKLLKDSIAQTLKKQLDSMQFPEMEQRILSYSRSIYDFELPENQAKALAVIPIETLKQRAKENPQPLPGKDELLRQLLHWFKKEFFKWVNQPECDHCHAAETEGIGGDRPNQEEQKFGAGRVEIYRCKKCSKITRFPRYNNSGKLMETKRGRCGEWAQAFTLCCRALKYEARFVVDWTDHVWTEVFSDELQRWVHCDPCEDAYDSPFMYECGWGKKLSYIIAFSVDEARDVSRRYTRDYKNMLERRMMCSELWLQELLEKVTQSRGKGKLVQERWEREMIELEENLSDEDRKLKDSEKIGRLTGSVEWKKQRGELGDLVLTNKIEEEEKQKATHNPVSEEEKKEVKKVELKAVIQGYFIQLSKGCNETRHSKFCKSSPYFECISMDAQETLKFAIKLATEHSSSELCRVLSK